MSNFPQGTLPRLIQVALAEVGTAETGNNETKYGKHMKADKLPWCGSFLNWCADQAGVKVPNVVNTRLGADGFKQKNQWHESPKIGDFVFFDFDANRVVRINHVGLVIRVSDTQIVTIEGNTSDGGDQRNGGEVMIKTRKLGAKTKVVGFGRPNYAPFTGDLPERPKGENK
jgi:uncharacterized protein (TIGR02594 family)